MRLTVNNPESTTASYVDENTVVAINVKYI